MKRGSTDVPAAERRLFFFRIRPICPLPESVYFAHSTLAAAILLPTLGIATYAPFRRLSRQQCRKRDSTSAMLRVDVGATICSDSRQASCLGLRSYVILDSPQPLLYEPGQHALRSLFFLPSPTSCLPTTSLSFSPLQDGI